MADVRHRPIRVSQILVVLSRGGAFPSKCSLGPEEQAGGLNRFRRPRIELTPLIGPGLEYPGARKQRGAAFQVMQKERKLDLLAIVKAGFGAEVDVTHAIAVAARETAVSPGAHHE